MKIAGASPSGRRVELEGIRTGIAFGPSVSEVNRVRLRLLPGVYGFDLAVSIDQNARFLMIFAKRLTKPGAMLTYL